MTETTQPPTTPKPVPAPVSNDLVVFKIVLTQQQAEGQFVVLFNKMMEQANANSTNKGFWDKDKGQDDDFKKLLLMHSEISEIMEALREGNPPDDKCPDFSSTEVELADLFIRGMDWAKQRGLRLPEAILAKHKYNLTRPEMHGNKLF